MKYIQSFVKFQISDMKIKMKIAKRLLLTYLNLNCDKQLLT